MSRLDRPALVWGTVFTTIALAYLLQEFDVWTVRLGVLVPLLLVVAGLALVVSATVPTGRAGR